jgi:NADH-quinone oxidoreductase subunit A
MNGDTTGYRFLAVFLMVALVFPLVPLALAYLWSRWTSPPKNGPVKNSTFECGLESKGDSWIQFRSDFYIYAIVFLVFDVETVFLLPFAVSFQGLSVGAFLAMLLFILLLLEGLVWAWRKGVLHWR